MRTFARLAFYGLLVTVAAVTLITRPYLLTEVRTHHLSSLYILLGPLVFTALFLLFCIDEIFIKGRKKGYHRTSLVPISFGALLIILLLPSSLHEYNTRKVAGIMDSNFYNDLIKSKDARVRTLVVLASSYTLQSGEEWKRLMAKSLQDSDPLVRDTALEEISLQLGYIFTPDEMGIEEAREKLKNWDPSLFMSRKSTLK